MWQLNKIIRIFRFNNFFFLFTQIYAPIHSQYLPLSLIHLFQRSFHFWKLGSLMLTSQHLGCLPNPHSGVLLLVPSILKIARSPVEPDQGCIGDEGVLQYFSWLKIAKFSQIDRCNSFCSAVNTFETSFAHSLRIDKLSCNIWGIVSLLTPSLDDNIWIVRRRSECTQHT